MKVTFPCVRGAAVAEGPATARYGADTACVSVEAPGQEPILLDLGTGEAGSAAPVSGAATPTPSRDAVLVAPESGSHRLALFHHDPGHDDDRIDRLAAGGRRTADRLGVDEVIGAAQGTTVSFDP